MKSERGGVEGVGEEEEEEDVGGGRAADMEWAAL